MNFGEYEKTFNNNFSNPNSRLPSAFGFKGHGIGIPISGRSTNANTNNKTSSFASIESNMFNFPNNANMNIIYNNNNNINSNNNINNNLNINNNNIGYNNNIINNNINNNIINYNNSNINSINYIEKEFEPNVSIKKILSLEDQRSTMMIKNIPNKFTREKLLELINKNFLGTYDLFILPKFSSCQKMEIKTEISDTLLLILYQVILYLIFILLSMGKNGLTRIRTRFVKLLIVKFKEEVSLFLIIQIKLYISMINWMLKMEISFLYLKII